MLRFDAVRALPSTWAATAAAAGVVAALLLHTTADPDLWGHLAFGRQIVERGIVLTDTFSYTASGAPFVDHEWLSDVVSYAAFDRAGPAGLVALRLGLLGVMSLMVALAVRRARGDGLATALVLTVVVLGGFPWFVTARPQLFTFACFAALVLALACADDGELRPLQLTPVLTLAWVNLHGGVVAGLGVLGCWGALRLVQWGVAEIGVQRPAWLARGAPSRRTAATIGLVLVLQVPVALANPYGVALWRFFAATLTASRVEIGEWQRVTPGNLGDLLGLLALGTLAVLIVRSRRPRDPVHAAIVTLLVLAALGARRHLALAVLASAILGAPHVVEVLARRRMPAPVGGALPAVAVALAGILVGVGIPRAGCVVVEPGTEPQAAVAYLRRAQVEGNLAVLFDWGSYAIWHLAPRLRVSIDGRREAVYSPVQLRENAAFLYGWPGWRTGLDRDRADLALVSPRFAVYARLAHEPDWRLAFADDTAGVFVRRGSPADTTLGRTAPAPAAAPGLCLDRDG